MPYQISISLPEDMLDVYQKYRWPKPIINLGDCYSNIVLNFDWKSCSLGLHHDCVPNNRYKIISNISTLDSDVYQNGYLTFSFKY